MCRSRMIQIATAMEFSIKEHIISIFFCFLLKSISTCPFCSTAESLQRLGKSDATNLVLGDLQLLFQSMDGRSIWIISTQDN